MLGASGFFFSAMKIDRNYIVPATICFLVFLLFLWVWQVMIFRYLPIAVDEDGVATIFRGKSRTHVGWADIATVEKRKVKSITSPIPRMGYTIVGANAKIYFDNGLVGFGDLAARINEHVKIS